MSDKEVVRLTADVVGNLGSIDSSNIPDDEGLQVWLDAPFRTLRARVSGTM